MNDETARREIERISQAILRRAAEEQFKAIADVRMAQSLQCYANVFHGPVLLAFCQNVMKDYPEFQRSN